MSDAIDVLPAVTTWNDESGGHRPKNQWKQRLGITHNETGFHIQCNHSIIEKGGMSPRHRHNFEQIRYVLEGRLKVGRKQYGRGTLIYIGESVYYGPQSRDEDTRWLMFQFPGPSGIPKFANPEIRKGRDELRAQGVVFQHGIAHFPSGKKQDGMEAIWECVAGREIEYAPPRYEDPVFVYSEAFPWRSTGHQGVSIKHLAYFNECGPSVSLLRLQPGASLPRGKLSWLEMRLVIEGEIEYAGKTCPAVSRIYCPPNATYDETISRSGATLFVLQIAVPGGDYPTR
jgi:hypothetical protein